MEREQVWVVTVLQEDWENCEYNAYCQGVFADRDVAVAVVNEMVAEFKENAEGKGREFELEKDQEDDEDNCEWVCIESLEDDELQYKETITVMSKEVE